MFDMYRYIVYTTETYFQREWWEVKEIKRTRTRIRMTRRKRKER